MAVGSEVNTQYQEILFKPGINKNNTSYSNEGGWIDGDKVRFRDGHPRKIGGWQRQTTEMVSGVARDIIAWSTLDSEKLLGIGTDKKVEIYFGGQYFDVTPVRFAFNSVSAISTSAGSSDVVILVSSHDANVGDDIIVHSNTTVASNVFFDGTYTIVSVVDANSLIVDYGVAATSTVTSEADISGYTLLQNGLEYNQIAFGWGAGSYGVGTWGTPRTASTLTTNMRQWTFDTWGEDLLACERGGLIYVWDKTNGLDTPMFEVTAAPSENNAIIVSYPTRHLVALGTVEQATSVFDPMLVRWCSSENYNDWNVSTAGTAGFLRLQQGNTLIGAEPSKNDILVFTDAASYSMRYEGYPDIFSFDLIGEGAGCVSPHAAMNIDGVVFWMSDSAFYRYDGALKTLNCTIRDVIFNVENDYGLNTAQKDMVFAGLNQEFNEIIWFYPSKDSTKCDRYIIYNYLEDSWYDGSIERSVWQGVNIFPKPFAINNDGVLYGHELGHNDDANPMDSWIQSAMFDIDKGDEIMFIDKFIPDFNQVGDLTITFITQKYPQSQETFTKTYTLSSGSGKLSMRARGIQASVKFQSNTANGNYIVGKPRFSLKPDGGR